MVFLSFSFVALLPLWIFEYLPLGEYANHLLTVFAAGRYSDPAFGFSRFFLIEHFPYPNILGYALIRFFGLFFPVAAAGRIFLSLYVVGFALSMIYYLRAVDRERTVFAFLAFLFSRSWFFHTGFVNFLAGIPCYFLALGLWERSQGRRSPLLWALLGALILCVYFSCLVTFIVLLLSLFLLSALSRDRRRNILSSAAAAAPSLALFVAFAFRSVGGHGWAAPYYSSFFDRIKSIFAHSFLSFSELDLIIVMLPLMLVAAARYALFPGEFGHGCERGKATGRSLVLFLALAAVYAAAPAGAGGWWPVGPLVIPLLFCFPLAFTARPVSIRMKWFVTAVAGAFLVLQTAILILEYRPFSRRFAELENGWKSLPRGASVLPVVTDGRGGSRNTEPYLYFWAYYHLKKGGGGPYFFAYPRLERKSTFLVYRDFTSLPNPGLFRDYEDRLRTAVSSGAYDYIAVFGVYEKLDIILSRYALFETAGKLAIYKRKV